MIIISDPVAGSSNHVFLPCINQLRCVPAVVSELAAAMLVYKKKLAISVGDVLCIAR